MLRTLLFSALAVAGLAPTAFAQATVYEGFNYPPGSPPPAWNGGVGWSPNTPFWNITAGGQYGVMPGSLAYSTPTSGSLATSGNLMDTLVFPPQPVGNRLTRAFATDLAGSNGGHWWMSFLIRKRTGPAAGDYGGITLGDGGGATADVGRLFIGEPSGSDRWVLERAGGGNFADSGVASVPGSHTLLVVELQINNTGHDTARLFVNPAELGGVPPAAPHATLTTLDFNPQGIQVSLVNIDFGASSFQFDEIRVGPTYASVTPVPEPGAWLAVAAAVAGLAGSVRRRV